MSSRYEFGFIGAGNMAEGIVAAMLKEKLFGPYEIIVSDTVPERLEYFSSKFGVDVTPDNSQLVTDSHRIVFSVKPQIFDTVAAELNAVVTAEQLLISIMAGVGTRKIEAAFDHIKARVIRVMPNLPIRVGAGVAGLFAGQYATEKDVKDTCTLFDAGGGTVVLQDEGLMDAVTAVSGSGPAYFYYFVEAIVAGGVASGLSEEDALKLAKYTCLGAGRMMLESDEPPVELRRKVTSKGGTTQAALEHMEKCHVGDAIRDAVKAAFQRGRELGA